MVSLEYGICYRCIASIEMMDQVYIRPGIAITSSRTFRGWWLVNGARYAPSENLSGMSML